MISQNKILKDVTYSAGDSVRDYVRDSVYISVWESVYISVWESVWDSVWNSVWDSVNIKLKSYDFTK